MFSPKIGYKAKMPTFVTHIQCIARSSSYYIKAKKKEYKIKDKKGRNSLYLQMAQLSLLKFPRSQKLW